MSLPLPDEPPLLPELAPFRRPRLRPEVPILWRSATSVQLGDDVIVDRIDRSLVAWMTSLDGLQSPDVVEQSLTIPEQDARRLVRALLAAGALDDAARIPDRQRWASPAERDAASARFSAVMDTWRDLDDAFDVVAQRDRMRVAVCGHGALAEAVAHALDDAGLAVDDEHATITVLAHATHPDVPEHIVAASLDHAHLPIGVLGARAVIGPLVVPGRTSCLRCAHLHRRDADPSWPLVAVQWTQALNALAVHPADPVLVRLAAGHAALLVRLMADHPEDPSLWSGFALDVRLPLACVTQSERPAHPMCGCRWPAQ